MLTAETVRRFNVTRALIYCNSPQVQQQGNKIVILDEHKNIADTVAVLESHLSYKTLTTMIKENPLSVELVSLNGTPTIRTCGFKCHLAFMLT